MPDLLNELIELSDRFDKLKPELEMSVFDPRTDMQGYVVVWNTVDDPYSGLGRIGKGGTRITESVTLQEIGMLAKKMALKNAAAGLPLGGAKSGLRAEPTAPGFEKIYRSFVRSIKPVLYEHGGIFGGFGFDIGARPEHALWACDELKSTRSFTGKPLDMGGTDYDREGIAGLGVSTAAIKTLEHFQMQPSRMTYGVQGLGAMGSAVIRYFSQTGARLSYISDPQIGGTFKISEGDFENLRDPLVKSNHVLIREYLAQANCAKLQLDEILFQPIDVLFPCAVQNVIIESNASKIRAKLIVEGANNPSSEAARSILFHRGITVVPDILANPGGSIAAFVELTPEVSPDENAVTKAKEMTVRLISRNVNHVLEIAKSHQLELAKVAHWFALKQLFKTNGVTSRHSTIDPASTGVEADSS